MNLKRSCCMAFLILALSPADGSAQDSGKRAFEIADYYRTAFVGAPQVSPDGSRVAFTVRRYDFQKGDTWSEIWMVSADGSGLRQMTAGKHNDSSPVWAPDGRTLYFSSDREGATSQLFRLPVDGGEATRLTRFSLDLSDPRVSPDGKWIAVTSEVFPECAADSECNARNQKGIDDGKLKVHVAEGLLYRHWTSWREGRYAHILLVEAATGDVVRDLTPGNWDSPSFSVSGDRGYDFSPDSKELCYVSNHDPKPASSTNSDLWLMSLDDGAEAAVNITEGNQGWDGAPLYSPDGRFIAYRSQATAGYESDLFRLALYDRSSRQIRYLTDRENFDNWVDELAWSGDSATVYFQAEGPALNPLYRIAVGSRQVAPVLADGSVFGWQVLPGTDALIYSRRTIGSPPEIFRTPIPDGTPRRLTFFNRGLEEEVDIRPAEEHWFAGDGDYKVQTFIIKPHGFDPSKKYPLILNVHGGPQSQWLDTYRGDWQVYPGKGYVVALANPTGSVGFGQDFVDAIQKDWGGRVYRDLMKVTDALEELPYVDKERMGAMGWSYGGYMMMWFQGHTTRFKALAAMMGVYNLTSMYGSTEELWFPEADLGGTPWDSGEYRKWSPSEFVEQFRTPSLVITGERDYRVPYTQSLEYFTALQKQSVPSKLIVFPGAGHWPSWYEMAFYYNAHLEWFHQWLGGEPAPYDSVRFSRNLLSEE